MRLVQLYNILQECDYSEFTRRAGKIETSGYCLVSSVQPKLIDTNRGEISKEFLEKEKRRVTWDPADDIETADDIKKYVDDMKSLYAASR